MLQRDEGTEVLWRKAGVHRPENKARARQVGVRLLCIDTLEITSMPRARHVSVMNLNINGGFFFPSHRHSELESKGLFTEHTASESYLSLHPEDYCCLRKIVLLFLQ